VTTAGSKKIAVIGCGNTNKSDDGLGPEVIRLLRDRKSLRDDSRVSLLDAGTDGMAVMFAARGCTALIVVDACRTGAGPGTIFEVPGHELESSPPHSINLHDFRWDHAIHAGRRIYAGSFPSHVVAYLVEARSVEFGIGLTQDMRSSANRVVDLIEARVLTHLGANPAP
jgi:hydrogenase maturation protease